MRSESDGEASETTQVLKHCIKPTCRRICQHYLSAVEVAIELNRTHLTFFFLSEGASKFSQFVLF
ncbi:MAG: hypothetical protein RMI34_07100 [Chloroherpetonaceae bacterium]|nr:hypothetical protein [Chloroherpetonaceae bacterium]MCS7211541.1 hypothetical protein [Chloroherpetonaceae bacterium]MDW8019825.1 hypothetical protein [Chloroherpetonaceae bacterium]MDW8465109.1 hypothetical protein [Chloroherpetonaceae bacterium]